MLGLSGAGKSRFCKYAANRNNWFYFAIDFWKPGIQDGLDCYGLREVWNIFEKHRNGAPLVRAILDRLDSEKKPGGVFDFPSSRVLTADQIRSIEASVKTVYLVGSPSLCIAARIQREKGIGCNLDERKLYLHWCRNNHELLSAVSDPELESSCVDVFKSGGLRKSEGELYDEVLNR